MASDGRPPSDEADRAVDDLVRRSMAELRDHPVLTVVPTQDPKLPLGDLPPETFERLCAELVDNETVSGEVHIYGRRGQAQYGIDIVKFRTGLQDVPPVAAHVFQVKRYKSMTPTKLRKAVELYAKSHRFNAAKFTVMTAAPTEDGPLLDELGKLKEEFAGRFDVELDGPTKIQNRLRKHPTTVRAVFGKAMAEALCGDPGLEPPLLLVDIKSPEPHIGALRRAMEKDFRYDDPVRFNEADLNGPSVDAMFVDVPVAADARTLAGQVLNSLDLGGIQLDWNHEQEVSFSLAPAMPQRQPSTGASGGSGPLSVRAREASYESTVLAGGAQALLHPRWLESAVIVGGPGQGKSTLLQYICQSQRARHLGIDEYEPDDQQIRTTAAMPRIPFRIDLRLYAKSRREILLQAAGLNNETHKRRRPKKRTPTHDINDPAWLRELPAETQRAILLESYISDLVSIAAGGSTFEINDLINVVSRWPVLFAFDGLDEVAPLDDRAAVSDVIREFRDRYSSEGVDVMVVVTTRPGVVERPIWNDPKFAVLELRDLVPALKMRYVEKWAAVSLPPNRRTQLTKAFEVEHDKPHVREVSASPMQLAILCRLLDRRTVIPDQRTALYDEYINVFFDREFEKSEAIRPYRPTLAKIHAYLGWWMHTEAENGESNGTIDVVTLRRLLHEFLTGIGQSTEMVDNLYTEMQARVICLVQRQQGSGLFEFEVQGIREYFAARYLAKELARSTSGTKGSRLGEAIRRPYWWNASRFAAGMFDDGELPEIVYVLRALQEKDFQRLPMPRLAAKQLLDDHIFRTVHRSVTKDLLKDALAETGLCLALDGLLAPGGGQFTFPAGPTADSLVEVLKDRISAESGEQRRAAAVLLCRQLDRTDGDPEARGLVWQWWWAKDGVAAQILDSSPSDWLEVASTLRLFSDLTPQEEERVLEAFSRAGAVTEMDALGLLARGGRWSPGAGLHLLCVSDIADGCADGYMPLAPTDSREHAPESPSNANDSKDVGGTDGDDGDPADETDEHGRLLVSGPLGQLMRAAQVDRWVAAAKKAGSRPVATSKPPSRRRFRGNDKDIRTAVATLDSAFDTFQTQPSASGWADLLDCLEDVWGDSWILGQILILTLPLSTQAAAVRAVSAEKRVDARAWQRLVAWAEAAEQNRNDLEWWRNALSLTEIGEGESVGKESMFRLAAAVALLNGLPVSQLASELNALCSRLTLKQWGQVAACCTRAASEYGRPLHLSQPLRTTFTPSARLATLLLTRADDAAASESVRYIFPHLAALWGASPAADSLLRRLVASAPRKVELDYLRGGKVSLPAGRFFTLPAVQKLTLVDCERVLSEPGQWPADVVKMAAEHAEGRITTKLLSLGELAAKKKWSVPGAH